MSGAAVGFHAADEPAEAIAMRLGQSEGIDRGAMEAGDGDARAALAAAMDGPFRRLLLVDQDEDELTLDDTVEALVAAHPDVPKVLVVDSVQTVAIRNPPRSESKREQIDAVVSRIKLLTKRHGLLTIVTSESNRAFYRSKRADEQSSALSAAAESRSIEYAATVLLTLRSASGVPNEVDVEIAKSRLGGRGETFRFRWDEVRALASEVAGSTGSTGSATPNRFEIVKAKVLEVVGQFDCDSATAVYGRTGGTKGVVLQAVRELRRDGTIVEVGGFLRVATPIGSTGSTGSERFDTGSRTGSYSTGSIGSTGSSPYRGEPVNRTGSRTDEPHSHEGDRFGQAEPVETSDDHDELDADDEQPPSAPRPVELAPQSHKEPFTDDGDRPNAPKARRHHG